MAYWFEVTNTDHLLSPALLFYPDRINANIDQMIRISGSADRLRPHIKTHKCRELIEMQLAKGIRKFKCATLTEARLLAESGATDILVAYPLVGPAQAQFIALTREFPQAQFSVLIDHEEQLKQWNQQEDAVSLYIDVDTGMHRTGISFERAKGLFQQVQASTHTFRGWHLYDGHIHDGDPMERKLSVEKALARLGDLLDHTNTHSAEIICGGSITFPVHATHPERQLSPGTTLLWDQGYTHNYPDLPFDIAACLLTRVISKPDQGLLCLDLGHKAVASEMKRSPIYLPQIEDAELVTHSEEHMVIKTAQSDRWHIGDVLYGFPWHICPTVALHQEAGVIRNGELNGFWTIAARNRIYHS